MRLPVEDEAPDQLEGTVKRIVFAGSENAWSVVRLQTGGKADDTITAVGYLPGVQPGEVVRLSGRWENDRRWGRQFKVATFMSITPSTRQGIEKYLGSGMLAGIGPVMAQRLVARFGLDTLDIIDQAPERLAEVDGFGPVRIRRLRDAWEESRHAREVMVFLQSHGVSAAYAQRIAKRYGQRAIATVRRNPYQLARDIHGIGFLTADAIARRLGVAADAPQRGEAGVLYALERFADDGHVYAPFDQLVNAACQLLDLPAPAVETAADRLCAEGAIIREQLEGEDALFTRALHQAEVRLATRVRQLLDQDGEHIADDTAAAITWVQQRQGLRLAAQQQEAVRRGLQSKLLIVTGGPGTGKTTLINALMRLLEDRQQRIRLAAPTGRAARRLAEATGREAQTLHRLLEFQPHDRSFHRHAGQPLDADLVIVDEFSMVDLPLADRLLQALPPAARLILIGDVDQLPSVGPGSVLTDLIASGVVHVVRLTEIFRQARESRIVVNAHRINQGDMPLPDGADGASDFFFIPREDPEDALATVRSLVGKRIPSRFRLDPRRDVQVLSPMHRGILGTTRLNETLRALLNPAGAELRRGDRLFRTGDKVMQVRNDYDRDVFNGDLGQVDGVDPESGGLSVRFEGRQVAYRAGDLDDLVPAYACTIHKSQGNEYPAVVIVLHHQHHVMLQRNLLYTAVTRGRRLVVVVGSRRALARAIHNDRVMRRHTRLAQRLTAAATGP